MASTDFTNRVTTVLASWLNPVNSAVYKANSAIAGVVAAMYRTALAKFADTKDLKDFGAACDGVVDDTAAITAAIAAMIEGETLNIYGTPLISSTININKRIALQFQGAQSPDSNLKSFFKKKSGVASFTGVTINAHVEWKGGGVHGDGSATDLGNGIEMLHNYGNLVDVTVEAVGGIGIMVGSTTVKSNYNLNKLTRCLVNGCGGDGIHLSDKTGEVPDCNVVVLSGCNSSNNQGDGFHLGNANMTQLDGCLGEGNIGAGLRISGEARWSLINGGNYEGNSGGQIVIETYAPFTQIKGHIPITQITTDNGYYTQKFNYYESKENIWDPAICGLSTPTINATLDAVAGNFPSNVAVTLDAPSHGLTTGDTVWLYGGTAAVDNNSQLLGSYIVTVLDTDTLTISVPPGKSQLEPAVVAGTILLRDCGTYTTQVGRWWFSDNARCIEFFAYVKSSALGAIDGQIAFILPSGATSLANAFQPINISFHEGVTYSANIGQIAAIAVPNSQYASIWQCSSAGAAAAALLVAGLAADHGWVVSGKLRVA